MKVKIKDLLPNPFRDMENYPIDEEKVESLINSIDETGFWDNILARKRGNNIEIAYGHHRLVALKKIFQPDDEVDIPVKELNDETMILIMANENNEVWGTSPKIVCETVRTVKKYLEGHTEILRNLPGIVGRLRSLNYPIGAKIIAEWLGKNWSMSRVEEALKINKLVEDKKLDKEAIESFPSMTSADKFIRATKSVKTIPEQQKRIVKQIIEGGDLSLGGMTSTMLHEKYDKKKTEAEKKAQKVENFITRFAKDMKQVNRDFDTVKRYREQYDLDFETGSKNLEISSFILEFQILLKNIGGLGYEITKKKSLKVKEEEGGGEKNG